MIKCIVTVCGTLSRTAIKRTNREGNPFSAFGIKVIIPDNTGNDKVIEISVAKDGDEDLSMLTIGSRIEVTGVLTFHKKEDNIWLNLSATGINSFNAGNKDFITGDMEFRGTLGKKTIEIKKTRKANLSRFSLLTVLNVSHLQQRMKSRNMPLSGYVSSSSMLSVRIGLRHLLESMSREI